MSNFSFPEKCSYCHERLGSFHCLLPFEFSKIYVRLEDPLQDAIQLSDIHSQYGFDRLLANLNLVQWFLNHPRSQSSSQHERVQDEVHSLRQFDHMHSQVAPPFHPFNEESISYSILETLGLRKNVNKRTTAWIKHNDADDSLYHGIQKDSVVSDAPSSQCASNDDTGSNEQSSIKDSSTKLDVHQPNSIQDLMVLKNVDTLVLPEPTNVGSKSHDEPLVIKETSARPMSIADDASLHALNIIAKSISFLYKLEEKKITKLQTKALKQSLMFEINLRLKLGPTFKAKMVTEIDHPIALAKVLVAAHTDADLTAWKFGRTLQCSRFCLLNFSAFFSTNIYERLTSLFDCTLIYCKSGIYLLGEIFGKDTVNDAINSIFKQLGYPMLLTWLDMTHLTPRSTLNHMDYHFDGKNDVNFIIDLDNREQMLRKIILDLEDTDGVSTPYFGSRDETIWKLIRLVCKHLDSNENWKHSDSTITISEYYDLTRALSFTLPAKERPNCQTFLQRIVDSYKSLNL